MAASPRPSRSPGRCRRCGGWIRRGQDVLLAPFRHPGCDARERPNPDQKSIDDSFVLVEREIERIPVSSARAFVVVMHADTIDRLLAGLASRLLAIDAQHDGYVRFNPSHPQDCARLCGERRRDVEREIEYLQAQRALGVMQQEER